MKNKIIIGSLILIILILVWRGCGISTQNDQLQDKLDLEKAEKDTLAYNFNKKTNEWEYSKQTYAAANGQLTDFLAEKDKELSELKKSKKASVGIITKYETRIDTVVNNIVGVDPTNIDSVRRATIIDKDYKADIVSWPNKTSLALVAWDSVKYSIGPDYRLVATHSSKLVKVTELNSFYVKPDVKKKNWKYWAGAIIGGAIVYGITR